MAGVYSAACCCRVCGSRAMMPAKIMSEMPLPMPYSVMSSPSHIMMSVPVVTAMSVVNHWNSVNAPMELCRSRQTVSK